jgi:L-fuconolactonase
VIDGHQHFWATARGDYGWLTPELAPIFRDFGPADLAPHLQAHGIAQTVLVQAAPTAAETDWMLDLAARTPSVMAVVGWADFEAKDAAGRIAALARHPKLRALRPMLQDLPDDAWMLRDSLLPAYGAIIESGLCFDALVMPKHLGHLIRLAERLPDLRVVIDHAAKPAIAAWQLGGLEFRAWSANLRALAATGAYCKLSGLATEAARGWQVDDLRPYFDVLMRHFGPSKLVWGSDWPVLLLNGTYNAWRHATDALLAELPSPDRNAILGGNAAVFYGPTA